VTSTHFAKEARGSLGRVFQTLDQHSNWRDCLFQALSHEGATFIELQHLIQEIVQSVEKAKQKKREDEEEKMLDPWKESISSVYQDHLQKQIEGSSSGLMIQMAHEIFLEILFWHRDLHLIQLGGDRRHLYHKDWEEALEARVQRGNLTDLSNVHAAVIKAKDSYIRQISLQICLERLFLDIHK